MEKLKHYLLEKVLRHYAQNVDQVLAQISISSLLFGTVRLDELQFNPDAGQDLLFNYLFFGCEIVDLKGFNVVVTLDWLSLSSKSIRLHIPRLELVAVLHDPNDLESESSKKFWSAQRLRHQVSTEAIRKPSESTLLYKVTGGLDISIDDALITIRQLEDEEPRLRGSLRGLRYCPANSEGTPTTDLDVSIRPRLKNHEVAYSYHLEIGAIALSVIPTVEDTWEEEVCFSVEGFTLGSMGEVAAHKKLESYFYMTSLLGIQVKELRTAGPVALERLTNLVAVLSRMIASDYLRTDGLPWKDLEKDPGIEEESSPKADSPGNPSSPGAIDAQSAESCDPLLRERLLTVDQTKRDMADILHVASSWHKSSNSPDKSHDVSKAPTSQEDGVASGDEYDSDGFQDCEELRLLELPDKQPSFTSCSDHEPEKVVMKRSVFDIASCNFQVVGPRGVVGFQLEEFRYSSDKRVEHSVENVSCLRTMFELPPAWLDPNNIDARVDDIGIIYAGMSLSTICVSLQPHGEARCELVNLQRGLKLRHRGRGDPCIISSGPQQLLEVEVDGLIVRDFGREEVEDIGKAFSAAVTAFPETGEAAAEDEIQVPISYSLEAVDISVEVGPSIGQKPLYCTLPCLRLRNVFSEFDDIWNYTLSGLQVSRGMNRAVDPLGNMEAKDALVESESSILAHLPQMRNAQEEISSLECQLAKESAAAAAERERALRLEKKLVEVFRMVQHIPNTPMHMVHQILATGSIADSSPSEMVPMLPDVETATYEVDVGEDVQHRVEELKRGEMVEWVIQERFDLTIDVTVVVRSKCRLHAGRVLRETVRITQSRDCFEVTDDFSDAMLPLTLEIRISNAFSWRAGKSVSVQVSRAYWDTEELAKAM